MSHHFDTPTGREDPTINLCDFYLFPGGPQCTVMVMTTNPQADPTKSALFREEGLYVFRFDTDGDAREDVSFKVQFSDTAHADGGEHVQRLEVRRGTGNDAGLGPDGDVLATGMTSEIINADSGVKAFAGVTPDPFAADAKGLEAFKAALARGEYRPAAFDNHMNAFAPRRVAAIALEVPNKLIGTGMVHSWVTISLHGHAPEQQVARWGLPLITQLYLTDEDLREEYNRSAPSQTNTRVTAGIAEMIRQTTSLAGTTTNPETYAQRVIDRFGTMTLPYEIGSPASFDHTNFNGRKLSDDVMDVMLSTATNSALGDGVTPEPQRVASSFPYLISHIGH
jgi:hypothetical protein